MTFSLTLLAFVIFTGGFTSAQEKLRPGPDKSLYKDYSPYPQSDSGYVSDFAGLLRIWLDYGDYQKIRQERRFLKSDKITVFTQKILIPCSLQTTAIWTSKSRFPCVCAIFTISLSIVQNFYQDLKLLEANGTAPASRRDSLPFPSMKNSLLHFMLDSA